MKQLTKLIFLLTSIMILSACSILSKETKREEYEGYIERVSEVYPTEKVPDLFKKFPNGFEIEHTRTEELGDKLFSHTIYLLGDPVNKDLKGVYQKKEFIVDRYEIIDEIPIFYTDEAGISTFEDYTFEPFVKNIRFLFTRKNFSKNELSKLQFNSAGGNPLLEDNFAVNYLTKDRTLNAYLGIDTNAELSIEFRGSKHKIKSKEYYLQITLTELNSEHVKRHLTETISQNIEEKIK